MAAPREAAEAIQDWMETHGGDVRLSGPGANLAALSDALVGSHRYFTSCGRLVSFLHKHGRGSLDVVVDMHFDQS